MSNEGSVTRWLQPLARGDQEAARQLFGQYFRRLVGLARNRLADAPRAAADEEDVALSAFHSFCRGLQQGRIEKPSNRHSLWGLLAVITVRKAARLKRSPKPPHLELHEHASGVPGHEPTP